MPKYRTLKRLLTNTVNKDALPDIDFTDNSIQLLGTSIEHLSMSNLTKTEFKANAKNVNTAVDEYQYTVNNMVDHYHDLTPIKTVADAFANQLYVGVKSLSNVKKTVNRLADDVDRLSNRMMAEIPAISSTMEHLEEPSVKFDKINWDQLNDINEAVVYANLNATIALEAGEVSTRNQIQILINRLPFGTVDSNAKINKIHINKKAAKNTLDTVFKRIRNVSLKDVKYVLTMLFDLDEIKCRSAINTFSDALYNSENINSIIQMARDFTLVLDHVNADTLKFSASTVKELLARKDILVKYADMATYISSFYRSTIWADAIMVPGKRLNPDNWKEFRNNGGTSIGLAHHLNHYYHDTDIPSTGIRTKEVLEKRDMVITAAKEEAATNMAYINERKKTIRRNAFMAVAMGWLNKNKKKWSPQFASAGDINPFITAVYDSSVNASIESVLYKLILNSCCLNTVTSKLHKNLSDIYLKHVQVGGIVTDEQREALDLTVYANMITDFILQQKMIEVK